MNDFDVIFGMDWLAKYIICLDCFCKVITFKVNEFNASVLFGGLQKKCDTTLISIFKAERMMCSGCKGYIAFISKKKPVKELGGIHVASKFLDVLPNEVSGLPPGREVDFTIELVLDTTMFSNAPYGEGQLNGPA